MKPKLNRPTLLAAARGSASVLKYLRADEWTMGNGQCHDCCGSKPRAGWWTDTVGHKPNCKKAKSIEALGGKVVWEHFNHSKRRRSHLRFFRKMFEDAKTQNESSQATASGGEASKPK